MRKRSCLDIAFFKESCLIYLLNFHYIVLFSIFQLISSVLFILSGPAWIAMCHCLRQPAEGKKVRLKDYFLCFWQHAGVGMLYSMIICSAMTGMFFGSILGNVVEGSALAISSQICASLLLALTIFTPFTLTKGRKFLSALFDSCMYFFGNFVAASMLMATIVIVFLLSWWVTPILTLLIFPGTIGFCVSRTIVGINQDLDSDQ